MKTAFVFPGCFAPPTYGHFEIAKRAAEVFPEITIVCSTNKSKSAPRWFSEDDCKKMWSYYDLPKNVRVKTFAEYGKAGVDFTKIVMIRGIRDEDDMEDEKRVMKLNKEMFGIDKVFYLLAGDASKNISATKARKAAEDLDFQTLARCVSPRIVTLLLEKTLRASSLRMVVGKPGSGKSTFLKILAEIDSKTAHINTDTFSKTLRPLIQEHFGQKSDLISLALNHDEELTRVIAPAWFTLLKNSLLALPTGSNIFVEIPYGLRPGKDMFRFIGARIIYVGCEDEKTNYERVSERGTKRHSGFIAAIPGIAESLEIARHNRLTLQVVSTDGSLDDLRATAHKFIAEISKQKEVRDEILT